MGSIHHGALWHHSLKRVKKVVAIALVVFHWGGEASHCSNKHFRSMVFWNLGPETKLLFANQGLEGPWTKQKWTKRIEASKIAPQKREPHKLKPHQQIGFYRHRLWAHHHTIDRQTSLCDFAVSILVEGYCWFALLDTFHLRVFL